LADFHKNHQVTVLECFDANNLKTKKDLVGIMTVLFWCQYWKWQNCHFQIMQHFDSAANL